MGKQIVSFAGQSIAIDFDHADAGQLVHFLFCDLKRNHSVAPAITLRIRRAKGGNGMSLYNGSQRLYHGDSRHALAENLMNETIYHLIRENKAGHMLHAAALSFNGKGVLMPGQSGSGKSTLAAWLTHHSLNYLTDELVFLSDTSHRIAPFTRPICLKEAGVVPLMEQIHIDRQKTLAGAGRMMISHRLINSDPLLSEPRPHVILFPHFQAGGDIKLTRLSVAQSGLRLMGCHVNARNLSGHGFGEMVKLARNAKSFSVTYNGFDGLLEALAPIISEMVSSR